MNTAIVLVLAVVCFFIGIIVAYLAQSLKEESKLGQPTLSPAVEKAAWVSSSISETGPSPEMSATDVEEQDAGRSLTPPYGMEEIARFWRVESSQRPALEMDGNIYRKPDELSLTQMKKLESTLNELGTWLGKPILTQRTPVEASAFLPSDVSQPTGFKPPRLGPLDILKNSLDADVRSTLKSAPKSLAAQVDEILQSKLEGSQLAERGIRIMDTPSADLVVMVGLDKYDGVDAIPEMEIQAVIKEAVAEWGRRTSLEGGIAD